MTKLDTKERKALPAKDFGLPNERKYPMPDKAHARNALARADAQYNSGKLGAADRSKIAGKAKHILDNK